MNYRISKNAPEFNDSLDVIIRERFGKGLDKRPVGRAVVQRKMILLPEWPSITTKLKSFKFLPEKRGQVVYSPMVSLFVFIVVAFLAVVMLAGMQYAMHLIYNELGKVQDIHLPGGTVNMTNANEMTFGKATAATDNLTLVSMAIIFSMMMSIVLCNFFIRTHPVMWILYVMITVLAIIFAVPVSNSYSALLDSGAMGGYLAQHTMGNYILLHLPVIVCILGFLGIIVMLINIIRSESEGGLLK